MIFPLAILVGGFEAIHALHVGAERIGRYLQVYYEDTPDAPNWETTAMAVGPALPGGGIDPLFSVVFISATLANLIPAFMPEPTRPELAHPAPAAPRLRRAHRPRPRRGRAPARGRTRKLPRHQDPDSNPLKPIQAGGEGVRAGGHNDRQIRAKVCAASVVTLAVHALLPCAGHGG